MLIALLYLFLQILRRHGGTALFKSMGNSFVQGPFTTQKWPNFGCGVILWYKWTHLQETFLSLWICVYRYMCIYKNICIHISNPGSVTSNLKCDVLWQKCDVTHFGSIPSLSHTQTQVWLLGIFRLGTTLKTYFWLVTVDSVGNFSHFTLSRHGIKRAMFLIAHSNCILRHIFCDH